MLVGVTGGCRYTDTGVVWGILDFKCVVQFKSLRGSGSPTERQKRSLGGWFTVEFLPPSGRPVRACVLMHGAVR